MFTYLYTFIAFSYTWRLSPKYPYSYLCTWIAVFTPSYRHWIHRTPLHLYYFFDTPLYLYWFYTTQSSLKSSSNYSITMSVVCRATSVPPTGWNSSFPVASAGPTGHAFPVTASVTSSTPAQAPSKSTSGQTRPMSGEDSGSCFPVSRRIWQLTVIGQQHKTFSTIVRPINANVS